MPLLSQALTTRARAKTFLGLSGDSRDSLIDLLINIATSAIERYCDRNLKSQTYTNQELDGTGSKTLILPQWPVTAFTQLQERDTDEPDVDNWTTIDDKEYYQYEDGRLVKRSGDKFLRTEPHWLSTPQRYRATYTAGYLIDFDNEASATHTLPFELEYACLKLVAAMFNTRNLEGLSSSKIGDQAVTAMSEIYGNKELKAILDKYRRPSF